jgi:hypothetical protein
MYDLALASDLSTMIKGCSMRIDIQSPGFDLTDGLLAHTEQQLLCAPNTARPPEGSVRVRKETAVQ